MQIFLVWTGLFDWLSFLRWTHLEIVLFFELRFLLEHEFYILLIFISIESTFI